ncbi:MAG: Glycerol-3-phosphate acyltransferase [Thermotoga sp. 50_1627]|uniref:glycerol-3-phosphate 1-O-acyltransferase PlsY n=1 Tax=Pseudothermotoga sp. TaxID=2033661 RepID=UPI00076CAC19|nr:MAG: Glycerol-3-phosphate acyltransferase [Thermotoga sp. 50_64]KUK24515.1 MAG: Glycerol-3-phosphate acyltransferase [Thermotoga sp. 50_1627]MBC7117278.1 glycerol-3-phosphate 1-O-acyltransferase PlsY [Pseudothermotoga sp.]MDK2923262.1 acyl phosphate:glycerol-3-phosphate acyltransferase [Pseudothermotoga sp.]HBT39227.1 acyl-phosphate glycerol 3-phosphate acyltransferase [Pseudothermotoga sp.]
MEYFLVGLISYLCGAVPFSYLLPRLKKIDVRKVGSGNVGGTNALRAAGPVIGFTCMVLDAVKTFIPVLVFAQLYNFDKNFVGVAAISAVLGHDFPVFLKFKGGKGVASTCGVFFALCPVCGFVFLGSWLALTLLTKYVSLASITSLFLASIVALFFNRDVAVLFFLLSALSTFRHSDNIERLLKGVERKTDLIGMVRKK